MIRAACLPLLLLVFDAVAGEGGEVLVADGERYVLRDGGRVAGDPGLELRADDHLVTLDDGLFVVRLHNDHVVLVEAELDLRVDELVQYGSAPSSIPVDEQVATLLDDETQEVLEDQLVERVAGWQLRMQSSVRSDLVDPNGTRFEVSGNLRPPPGPGRGYDGSTKSRERRVGLESEVETAPGGAVPQLLPVVAGDEIGAEGSALAALFLADEGLRQCAASAPGAKVVVRVVDGRIAKVKGPGCAIEGLMGRELAGEGKVRYRL
ncbi:MAG: hypothetical protein KC656_19270 [Myxococcales bacterium]|nr:hypothetical protein [Myxococcales bacterium]